MQPALPIIFLISSEPTAEWAINLQKVFYQVQFFNSSHKLDNLPDLPFSLVILDFEDEKSASLVIKTLLFKTPNVPIFVVSVSPDWSEARAIFRAGATDYLSRLGNNEELITALKKALDDVEP